jgi:hypothetical protein
MTDNNTWELDVHVRLNKFISYETDTTITLQGTSLADLEKQVEMLEDLDKTELTETVLDEEWWDDKHGWSCYEEMLAPEDLEDLAEIEFDLDTAVEDVQ